jgi:hypothetical protein
MEKGVLVDTCIWIDYFRDEPGLSTTLSDLIKKGVVFTAGIVLFELFQGIKNEKEKNLLKEVFKGINYVEMKTQTWLDAATMVKTIRCKGTTIPPSDIFLAQLAIENDLKIFTIDTHFKKIPGVVLM